MDDKTGKMLKEAHRLVEVLEESQWGGFAWPEAKVDEIMSALNLSYRSDGVERRRPALVRTASA